MSADYLQFLFGHGKCDRSFKKLNLQILPDEEAYII